MNGTLANLLRRVAVPVGLLLLAAALRLPDLATRGTWDGDQGHDMLVLRALVRDGVVPLLGPPTSIGDVHHGALYYYLLAPAAALTGGDSPLAVVGLIALAGIAAVVVTWWLARSIAGPVAGLVAGLAMAVSPAAIDESTFIWNPNLIALSSAIALAGAWHAWSTRRPAWWLLAAVGTAITMQCHVLGVTLLPIVGALLVADVRRRAWPDRGAVLQMGVLGLGLIALAFVPLIVHELTTDFAEVQAALAYLRAGGEPPSMGPLGRFAFIGARVVSWPLVGLIVDGASAAVLAVVAVVAVAVWRALGGLGGERVAARWLGLGLLWTATALTFISPSLAVVIRGLPNDHYHAFADPMVFVLVGMGAAGLWRLGRAAGVRPEGVAGAGRAAAGAAAAGRARRAGRRAWRQDPSRPVWRNARAWPRRRPVQAPGRPPARCGWGGDSRSSPSGRSWPGPRCMCPPPGIPTAASPPRPSPPNGSRPPPGLARSASCRCPTSSRSRPTPTRSCAAGASSSPARK